MHHLPPITTQSEDQLNEALLVGLGPLGPFSPTISSGLGFDPRSFREAILAGIPADNVGILWGDYDVVAVNQRFSSLGIERSDSDVATTWTIDADNTRREPGPLAEIAGPKSLNVARTQPMSFAYATKRDNLAWISDPGGNNLAEDPTTKALAACLGDVAAAVFARDFRMTQTVAVGIQASSASDVTAVICVAAHTKEQAEKIRATASAGLVNGTSLSGLPWSELLPDATTELSGDSPFTVRILAKPGASAQPGFLLRMVYPDIAELLGVFTVP